MNDEVINRILEKVVFIDAAIREQMLTKTEFVEFKSEIYSHIDGFIKLH